MLALEGDPGLGPDGVRGIGLGAVDGLVVLDIDVFNGPERQPRQDVMRQQPRPRVRGQPERHDAAGLRLRRRHAVDLHDQWPLVLDRPPRAEAGPLHPGLPHDEVPQDQCVHRLDHGQTGLVVLTSLAPFLPPFHPYRSPKFSSCLQGRD